MLSFLIFQFVYCHLVECLFHIHRITAFSRSFADMHQTPLCLELEQTKKANYASYLGPAHTLSANSAANPDTFESLQSGKKYIRNESDNVWTVNQDIFKSLT